MKKIIAFLISLVLLAGFLSADPSDSVNEYKLENGLTVFLLEDHSTPLIRIEYIVRAGFSSQTQETSGFFKLYSRVLEESFPEIQFDSVQCNSDSSRYIVTVPVSKLENTINVISEAAFNPHFSDETIKNQLAILKKEVKANFDSMSGFINAAIDSRVFSAAPWKHDSGVYPPIFSATTDKKARSILSLISDKWYTPGNSAVFISGNINSDQIQKLIENSFGRFYSTSKITGDRPEEPVITHKKFVLHNPEFSDEMTQVVLQYLSLNTEECNVAANLLNSNYSYFKYNLLTFGELNIPGDEYIDAASAHKKDCNRLIIQTLLQPPEDKKIKTNSLKQSLKFIEETERTVPQITPAEFVLAKQNAVTQMNYYNNSSISFMENLAAFWAMNPYESFRIDSLTDEKKSITTEMFLSQIPKIQDVSLSTISYKLQTEEPFVFVIINSSDYKKNKKEYDAAGFEEITVKNASWKNQSVFANIASYSGEETDVKQGTDLILSDNNYYEKNLESLKTYDLKNGISLITKFNPQTADTTILVSIRGGKLNTSNDHGFEEVMINILANNIQREIFSSQQKGLIEGSPSVSWQTDLTTSHITIECTSKDVENVCTCISNAIIYSDIIPSTADRSVSNRQYKKRLENGSAVNQLYSAAISYLYPKTDFINIFETDKDILESTNYQKIQQYYPLLLDSSRYTVIVTGSYPENIVQIMNNTIGLLANQKGKINISTGINQLTEQKSISVKVNHTFLTDIPAEKAGPMPAVLVPTTEFLDPVMYIFNSPKKGTKEEAVFNSMLLYLGQRLQNEINGNSRLKGATVNINPSKPQMDTAGLTIQNVPHTKELDSALKITIQSIKKELQSNKTNDVLQVIKDLWIQEELSLSYTNTGSAELLQKGLEYFPYLIKPEYYLEEYNFIQTSDLQDFISILDLFPEQPYLRLYSKEGKK